ncbi:indolepyruvate ferredoxin oxidoreductase family protein [Chitinimonas lacunae]|uniref:Indolepyruvate ferredoxin oxidoreductase family protein n=1 Tax=Chitinimonas lacunae TaxID=1963018 RepID=A0ABV8MQI5_9NEIS
MLKSAMPPAEVVTPEDISLDYQLDDALLAERGRVFLTGMRALVRLPLWQSELDRRAGLKTGGFVSGYRGSPLGGYDQQLQQAAAWLAERRIRFLPAVNEEMAATAVLGSQRVEADPEREVAGVFGLWYGKGPGLDRAGDALRHGHSYGASPHGGVLVVVGDDHGCVSSSMSHQSEGVMAAWSMPVLHPATLEEVLEFGLYGWALSRYSGAWVGLKLASETANTGASVSLDRIRTVWESSPDPDSDLHNRWPDLPGMAIEARLPRRLAAVARFAARHSIDRWINRAPTARLGILTCGKAALDVSAALDYLELDEAERGAVRIYKPGLVFPLERQRLAEFARGLTAVLVVEEKGPLLENQLRAQLYNLPDGERPRVLGKTDLDGRPLIPLVDELRPAMLAPLFAAFLRSQGGPVRDCLLPALPDSTGLPRRLPFYCAGCPHNLSTRVPEGSEAHGGTGCHFMASWMERDTVGLVQMGGEGVDWVAQAAFTRRRHIFQNLGDGTYFHSGVLAIRQAIAAGTAITFKILYNDAVAMTGGQAVDGRLSVPQLAWQLAHEGVRVIAVLGEGVARRRDQFPPGAWLGERDQLDSMQRRLREIDGVSALIFDQTCAAELRRRRKRQPETVPATRVFIHPELCDGCGDCGVQSNCVAIEPFDTPLGRKRRIDQSACNRDTACLDGFCPSMLSLHGAKPRRPAELGELLEQLVARLSPPPAALPDGPSCDVVVAGIGGTGVVTVGAIIAMAAHLCGRAVSSLDYTGMAQKGGAVHSFVRFADASVGLQQSRVDHGRAHLVLACDLVVGASPQVLATLRPGHSHVVLDPRETPTHQFVQDPDARLDGAALQAALSRAAGRTPALCEAQNLSRRLLGDAVCANMVLLGFAFQRGWLPLPLAALQRAIELNAVAVTQNLRAFALGRLAAVDAVPLPEPSPWQREEAPPQDVEALLARTMSLLGAYQNRRYAERYRQMVDTVRRRERALLGEEATLPLTLAVATSLARLMAYKDEYEVARLLSDGVLQARLGESFDGTPGQDYRFTFHLAPPLWLSRRRRGKRPAKTRFGQAFRWPLTLLAALKPLRGTLLDPFGWTHERRLERRLVGCYVLHINLILSQLNLGNHGDAVSFAKAAQGIRGFGPVKLANVARVEAIERRLAHRLGISYQSPLGEPRDEAETLAAPRRVIPLKQVP